LQVLHGCLLAKIKRLRKSFEKRFRLLIRRSALAQFFFRLKPKFLISAIWPMVLFPDFLRTLPDFIFGWFGHVHTFLPVNTAHSRHLTMGSAIGYSGALSSLESHPAASDCSGSATVTVSMKWHFVQPKLRFSLRSDTGELRASIIRVRQRGQCGRSIGVMGRSDKGMSFTLDQAQALPNSQSPNIAEG
jgi:hypothetical protein